MNLNQCVFAGNLTAEPELRYSPKGTAIVNGSLAVNRKWTGDDGQLKEEVAFIPFVAFNKTAENLAKFCAKGSNQCLTGRMRLEQWDDKQTGQKRSRLVLLVEQLHIIQFKDNGEGPARRSTPPTERQRPLTGAEARPPAGAPAASHGDDEPPQSDDVPFG